MEKNMALLAITCAAIFFALALSANSIISSINRNTKQLNVIQQTESAILSKLIQQK